MAYIDDVYSVVQIQPTGIEAFVRLSQNENGRRLYFAITGGEIPTGSTATLSGTKPDGVVYSTTGTIAGNVVTVLEDIQLTAAAGPWPAKLRILNGGNVVATGRIRFVIDKDPVAAGAVPSDSQLEGLVAEAAAYAEAAKDGAYYGSPLTASTVAGMTDKNRVYVYTGSESGYTAGNWYYWDGSAWTSGGVYNSQGIQTDKTLSVTGMAADAKAVGDALKEVQVETDKTLTQADVPADAKVVGDELTSLKADLSYVFSDEAKQALYDAVLHIGAWTDNNSQNYIDALYNALYPDTSITRIEAVFTQGDSVVYPETPLEDLKDRLIVTGYRNDGTSKRITNYTLSGTLSVGTSTVVVSAEGKTTTFTVIVSQGFVPFANFVSGNIAVVKETHPVMDPSDPTVSTSEYVALQQGMTIGFNDVALYDIYKFAIAPRVNNSVNWSAPGGSAGFAPRNDYAITVTSDYYYSIIRKIDGQAFTSEEIDLVNSSFGIKP